ncbi:MAG TPA: hypothetical protein VK920_02115 [Solirubrobacterales bacterium]|nr:hypothetical protein [Solirubrobacterales bacterium]
MDRETQAELDAVRESFQGELERKAARIAQLEKLIHEVDHGYRATLSWRITAPLRAIGRLSRTLRR